MKNGQDVFSLMREYLIDAVAVEKNFETQLRAMAKHADPGAAQVFAEHAEETKHQHERLAARLHDMGGSPSAFKTFLAYFLNSAPKLAQTGHRSAEVKTQDLIVAYSVESSEIAMYEALANSAATAGDLQTEQLAREIQEEERRAAQKVWALIAPAARNAMLEISDAEQRNPNLTSV